MAERSAGGGRRASLTMYDPLRDIYTTVPDDQDAAERVARHAAQVGVSDSEPKIMPDKEALSHTTDSPVGSPTCFVLMALQRVDLAGSGLDPEAPSSPFRPH